MTKGLVRGDDGSCRCWWAEGDPLLVAYHDVEWGRPERDDAALFELLTLEAFQSGLAWTTILRKRDGFRRAFAGFDIGRIARFGAADVERLLADPAIVRHRGKIEATSVLSLSQLSSASAQPTARPSASASQARHCARGGM